MSALAMTPEPPYYAVIFSSVLSPPATGYDAMAHKMLELAERQPGFLGFETARSDIGISVSYWKDEDSICAWKQQSDHLQAQELGRSLWYNQFKVRVCRVERETTHSAQQQAEEADSKF